jgi:hypothetical protein
MGAVVAFPSIRRGGQIRAVADSYFRTSRWRGEGNISRHVTVYRQKLEWFGVDPHEVAREVAAFHRAVIDEVNARLEAEAIANGDIPDEEVEDEACP